jgi:hypothetical protein
MGRSAFRRTLNRIAPALPVGAMKTYEIRSPRATHWRKATCAEVACPPYLNGWRTILDETTELGQRLAHTVRKVAGRAYTEHHAAPNLTIFTFEAGQRCFAADSHQLPTGRPELYVVRGGDWRGNPRGDVRKHARAADWVDDFATHQQQLADRLAQG